MNWNVFEGHWQRLKAKLGSRRAKLTGDHPEATAGCHLERTDALQEPFGITMDKAATPIKPPIKRFEDRNKASQARLPCRSDRCGTQ